MHLGEVLGKPFKIIWKHKILWVFGAIGCLFPTLIHSAISLGMVLVNQNLFSGEGAFSQLQHEFMTSPVYYWIRSLEQSELPISFLIFGGVVLIILLLNWLLPILAQSCIISGSRMTDENVADMRFTTILTQGWKPFGKMVLQNLLFGVVVAIPLILVGIAFFSAFSAPDSDTITLVLLTLCCSGVCVVLPGAFFYTLYTRAALISLGHDNSGVFTGMKQGWGAVKKAFGMYMLFHLIIIAMTYAVNFIPSIISSMGTTSTTLMSAFGSAADSGLTTSGIIIAVIVGIFDLVFSSFAFTYICCAWTIAYRRVAYPMEPVVPPAPAQVGSNATG